MPYRCRYCGGRFCPDHRLPENHECVGLRRIRENPRWRDYAAQVRRREVAAPRRQDRWDIQEDSGRRGFPGRIPFSTRAPWETPGDVSTLRRNFAIVLITALVVAIGVKLLL